MRIGVVSDTHGHTGYARKAVAALRDHDVAVVLHCGDIGSADIVGLFERWPTHFVFGNVDRNEKLLREAIERAGQTCHGRFGSLELEGRRIAFLHSDDSRRFHSTVTSRQWDLVCYGHTHVAEDHLEGSTLVLNPGALYRANPHSLAVVELATLDVHYVPLFPE